MCKFEDQFEEIINTGFAQTLTYKKEMKKNWKLLRKNKGNSYSLKLKFWDRMSFLFKFKSLAFPLYRF